MAREWFRLLPDGELVKAKEPSRPSAVYWKERDMENLFSLNPKLLDLQDGVPIRLGGIKGAVSSPDQFYLDPTGRVTVVEYKNEKASMAAVAQVIAYANHWQILPPGEIDKSMTDLNDRSGRMKTFGRALCDVKHWAGSVKTTNPIQWEELGHMAIQRLESGGLRMLGPDIASFASMHCDEKTLPCIGGPPRMVLVAPGFDRECNQFAEQLGSRRVAIELVEVDAAKCNDQIYVSRRWVYRDELAEPTWNLLRDLWIGKPSLGTSFAVNGWADALNHECFGLSARSVPDAKLWIWADDAEIGAGTVVPDGWHANRKHARRELRDCFLKTLPTGHDGGRWLEWTFRARREREKALKCIRGIAEAIREVLIPAAIDARQ